MTRTLFRTSRFTRHLKGVMKRSPHHRQAVTDTLAMLAADAFDPRLRTHKLQGGLSDRWSCSVVYDLRILFELMEDPEAGPSLLLQAIGTHDEVY